jgi:hypothetical protein
MGSNRAWEVDSWTRIAPSPENLLRQHPVFVEKCSQLRGQGGILLAERGQPRGTRIVGHSERLIQIWTESLPLIGTEWEHRLFKATNLGEFSDADKLSPSSAAPYILIRRA